MTPLRHGTINPTARFVLIVLGVTGALVLIGAHVIALILIGVVLGIMLDAVARFQERHLQVSRRFAVVVAALLFVIVVAGIVVGLALPLLREGSRLLASVSDQLDMLTRKFERDFPSLLQFLPTVQAPAGSDAAGGASATHVIGGAAKAIGWLAEALATFFLGVFLAWDPRRWIAGIATLWPGDSLERRLAAIDTVVAAVRSYLFTMMVYIVAMGTLWTVGLWLIGIDYPLVFGILGGLAEIVPYFGPLLALLPPLLLSAGLGAAKLALMILLYVVLHVVEGYLLVPYVLHMREHLPPPLVVLSILVCGAVLGPLGVVIALPVGLACYMLVQQFVYRRRARSDAQ